MTDESTAFSSWDPPGNGVSLSADSNSSQAASGEPVAADPIPAAGADRPGHKEGETEQGSSSVGTAEVAKTGAAPGGSMGPSTTESPVPAEDPSPFAGAKRPSREPNQDEAPQGDSSIAAEEASSIGREPGDPHGSAAMPVLNVKSIQEIGRANKTKITSWKPYFAVEKGSLDSFTEIVQRATCVRTPLLATPAPTGKGTYESTEELFRRLENAIVAQTAQSDPAGALLTYWVISTWFGDGLSLAPALAIIGPAYEGDLVLRALRNFCRNPLMMAGINSADLKNVDWKIPPTLLAYSPGLTKQMASLVGCSTRRGYLFGGAGKYQDFYCAKGLYLGEEAPADRVPRCSVQVSVLPTATSCTTQKAFRLAELEVQQLQNQLLTYRTKNLVRVYESDFDASTLTSDTRAIANAMGACIVDSPKLQEQLISLLTPAAEQQQADRSISLESLTIEATLNLYHKGNPQILVGAIASEVNRIAKDRGERLIYSAETIGRRLRKLGITTRRLGKAGNGLVMDLATVPQIHELASLYGGAGLDEDDKNKDCSFCPEKKPLPLIPVA